MWALVVFFVLGGVGVAVYMKAPRQFRRYIIVYGVLVVQWMVLGPQYTALINANIPQPSAPEITLPDGFEPPGNPFPTSDPADPATPTPDVPRMRTGATWADMPSAASGANGAQIKVFPGSIADEEFTIVGRYGDPPYNPLEYTIQVEIDGKAWWVQTPFLPYSSDELAQVILTEGVPNLKP